MNSLDEPLLLNANSQDEDDDRNETVNSLSSTSTNQSTPGLFIWLLTLAAGISGLLFGYDTGVISATLVSTGDALSNRNLTSLDKSLITSSTALAALLILPIASHLADTLGRKRIILFADVLFLVGAILQACSYTVASMIAGRAVVGAAVGAASFITPLYIAELAPTAHRGRLVTVNVVFVTLGQVVAYATGYAFATYADPKSGWRWMVGMGAVPAGVQMGLVFFMPETPRWLVKAGRSAQARSVIAKVAGAPVAATSTAKVLKDIEAEVREEAIGDASTNTSRRLSAWHELINVRKNRRALAIACLLQGLQQLCGFNSLMYFSATIFQMLSFDNPTLASMTVALTNLIFTVIALTIVDRVGRRRILLYSIPWMVIGLVLSAIAFSHVKVSTSTSSRLSIETTTPPSKWPLLILSSIILYVASYAIGLGNVPWMQSELFPLNVRSLGSGIATSTNWVSNFVVGLTFLPLMDALSPSWTFGMYALVCGLGYVVIWRRYPETSGLSLEDAGRLLERDDWGVVRRRM